MTVALRRKIALALAWIIVHIIFLAILADRFDYHPAVFGRYSLAYGGLLAILAATGILGAIVLWYVDLIYPPQWLQGLRRQWLFLIATLTLALIALIGIWWTPFQIFVMPVQKELLRAYGSLAVLSMAYVILFWRGQAVRVPYWIWATLAIFAIAAVGVVSLHYLDRFPQLNTIDELHNWSVQWTFANTGLLGDTLYKQMIPLPQPIYDSPHYILGFLLRFIGDDFWQARFARMLMACLALPFIYLCGKRMYGARAALFAVVFAAFLIPPVAYVRPDVFVGVMLSIALYVYMRAQDSHRPFIHYLTGLCVALGGEGHPLAYRFGLAFALLYVVRWGYEMVKTRRFFIDGRVIALGLGGFTGILIYLSIHILPNIQQGLHFASNNSTISMTLAARLKNAKDSIAQQFEIWVDTSPFELIFVVLGVAYALRERKHGDRLLLTVFIVSEVLILFTYGYYRQFYQVHFLPIFALLAGRVVADITARTESRVRSGRLAGVALAMLVFALMLVNLNGAAQAAVDDPYRDEFTSIARQLKADLPSNLVVVGNENYFIELHTLNYYGIETVTSDKFFLVNYQGYQLWQVTKPDVFILSGDMDLPKYTDLDSIYSYMNDNKFFLARCYTDTDMIEAQVYVRQLPQGWTVDPTCQKYSVEGQ